MQVRAFERYIPISAHVLLNFKTSWEKVLKCEACATSLINSIIEDHEC